MPTASYLITDIQTKLGDPSGNIYPTATLFNWLNEAQKELVQKTMPLRLLDGTDTIAGQNAFGMPSDRILIDFVTSRRKIPTILRHVTPTEFENQRAACPGAVSYDPDVWTEMDGQMYVYPAYGADSPSTRLIFDIGPNDTSAIVETTAGFPAFGRIRMDDEEMEYAEKTPTSFLGLSRGLANTPAESHDGNPAPFLAASVCQIVLYTVYRRAPNLLQFDTDEPDLPTAFQERLQLYVLYLAYMQAGETDKAKLVFAQWEDAVNSLKWILSREHLSQIGVHDFETQQTKSLYGPRA